MELTRRVVLLVVVVAGCAAPSPAGSTATPAGAPSGPIATSLATPTSDATATSPATTTPTTTAVPTEAPTTAAALTWTRLAPAADGPDAREDHTWTVDPGGTTAYLFGGRDGDKVRGDLWAYDLKTDVWRRLRPVGDQPQPRFGHEATWVDGIGLVIFAGQASPTTFFGDLWAYDPTAGAQGTWRRLPARGSPPTPRYGSCMALGPDGRLWISHGFTEDGTRFADTRAYDLASGTWADVTPGGRLPVERCLHGCWFQPDGRFSLYGGQTTGVAALGDLWTLDTTSVTAAWQQVRGDLPDDRRLYARTTLADGREAVFGGGGLDGAFHRDFYLVDPVSLAFSRPAVAGPTPPGRAGAELIADAARERLLLFGGKDGSRRFADRWSLPLPTG